MDNKNENVSIFGFAGSLRLGSYNKMLLKTAIDAASRPKGMNPFEEKPVGIMGASIGMLGTARAQYHLRQSMVILNAHIMNRPEIMVSFYNLKYIF